MDHFKCVFGLLLATAALSGCSDRSAKEVSGSDAKGQAETTKSIWECDWGDPRGPFSVILTGNSYEFKPYNPDDGALSGEVREASKDGWNGANMTTLEFVGGGAPVGRWGWVEEPGKRKALFMYAVESSGDGSECTPPGEGPQYMAS